MDRDLCNKILALSENYRDQTAVNLSKLVKIRSMSGEEEGMMEELKDQFTAAGINDIVTDGLGNLIARIGSGERVLAFDGHMDTVDVGQRNNWDFDPFSGEIKNGFVLGRGSVDQKGSLAALVTAAKILQKIGIPDDLSILFTATVMEEDCDGLCWKYIIEEGNIKPEAVVITEPTNLNISRGQRGRMEILTEFTGTSSHGSAPERGKNAIYMASRAALKIKEMNHLLPADDFLGKGSIAVTRIDSDSPALCAVADYSSIYLDRRLTLSETKEQSIYELEELMKEMDPVITVPYYNGRAYTGKQYGMEKYYPTWVMPENHEIIRKGIRTYSKLYGENPEVSKWLFSTNAVSIKGMYDIPVIGFGPGDEVMAHSPNEKIAINDLVKASAFYAGYAINFSTTK